MDNGEEIPCLNESWTFAGAKVNEWMAGLASMIIITELLQINAGRSMPILLTVWLGTTFALAVLRRQFVDEERGIRNFVMESLGFAPPGIPRPASLQPYWSGAPLRELKEDCWFSKLKLDDVLVAEEGSERNSGLQ